MLLQSYYNWLQPLPVLQVGDEESREHLIKTHYMARVAELTTQLQMSDSKAVHFHAEVRIGLFYSFSSFLNHTSLTDWNDNVDLGLEVETGTWPEGTTSCAHPAKCSVCPMNTPKENNIWFSKLSCFWLRWVVGMPVSVSSTRQARCCCSHSWLCCAFCSMFWICWPHF